MNADQFVAWAAHNADETVRLEAELTAARARIQRLEEALERVAECLGHPSCIERGLSFLCAGCLARAALADKPKGEP